MARKGGETFLRCILGAPLPTVSIANVLVTTSMTTKYSLNIHSSELRRSAKYEPTMFIMIANHEGIHGCNGGGGSNTVYSELRGSDPQEPIVYTYSRLCLEPTEYLAR